MLLNIILYIELNHVQRVKSKVEATKLVFVFVRDKSIDTLICWMF